MDIPDFFHKFPFPEPAKVRRKIYPLFLPFSGCGERCVFCAQDIQTGERQGTVEKKLEKAAIALKARRDRGLAPPELAFFGGTFTALPEKNFTACLDFAECMRKAGLVVAARCSTRPDALFPTRLEALKDAGFSLVELGVQSFSDRALSRSRRGYSGKEAQAGCESVLAAGLGLGVQLLPGMPGLDFDGAFEDVERTARLDPACVRLYPCLVLEGTVLAEYWRNGEYKPWEFSPTTEFLAHACLRFWQAGIAVIRIGLAEEPGIKENVLAGPRHPSLGNMARSLALYYYIRDRMLAAVGNGGAVPRLGKSSGSESVRLLAPRFCQGEFWGWKGSLAPLYAGIGLGKENVSWWEGKEFRLYGAETFMPVNSKLT
jgi:histone acetyltransferase (RNA polymerase elongator complex component)